MVPLVEQHREQIELLCRQYCVKRLELFGSAADGSFDHAASDVDLLVLFDPPGSMNVVDRYFEFHEALEKLFGRKVDLVDISVARNPYFVANALRNRVRLYAA